MCTDRSSHSNTAPVYSEPGAADRLIHIILLSNKLSASEAQRALRNCQEAANYITLTLQIIDLMKRTWYNIHSL